MSEPKTMHERCAEHATEARALLREMEACSSRLLLALKRYDADRPTDLGAANLTRAREAHEFLLTAMRKYAIAMKEMP